MSTPLRVEAVDGIAVLTLDRAKRRNALSVELVDALLEALDALEADAEVRVAVLTGAPPGFCAGGDLGSSPAGDGMLQQHDARGHFAELLGRLVGLRKPVIAAVNGDALGGGFGLAAACHLIVADESARFATPEIALGLFPMMIWPVLARNLPRKLLNELVLTGRKASAAELSAVGFVNRVSPAGQAVEQARALAGSIAERSPAVVALGLSSVATVADLPLDAALDHMRSQLTLNLLTEDAAEGISAFLARRPPSWKGR